MSETKRHYNIPAPQNTTEAMTWPRDGVSPVSVGLVTAEREGTQ
jgi:hypothetical protein